MRAQEINADRAETFSWWRNSKRRRVALFCGEREERSAAGMIAAYYHIGQKRAGPFPAPLQPHAARNKKIFRCCGLRISKIVGARGKYMLRTVVVMRINGREALAIVRGGLDPNSGRHVLEKGRRKWDASGVLFVNSW